MKIVGKIIRVLIIILIIFEGTKLFFLIFANMENRLIQENEIVNGKDVIYFNLIDATGDICDLELCEVLPELKVIKIEDGIFLRTGIDRFNSYYLKELFFKSEKEPKVTLPENKEMFKNRTYADQLLSWQTVSIFLEKNNLNIIYFLNKEAPYIGILSMEEKYVPNELAWVKLNNDNLTGDFLKIDGDKLNKFVTNNNLEMPYSIDELNEKISDSYSVIKDYEERLRVISILICVAKISLLFYILKHKKINLYLKQIFKKENKCTSE